MALNKLELHRAVMAVPVEEVVRIPPKVVEEDLQVQVDKEIMAAVEFMLHPLMAVVVAVALVLLV